MTSIKDAVGEKLGDANWAIWSVKMLALLTWKGCAQWVLVELPEVPNADQFENASKALSLIRLNISDRWLRLTSHHLSPFAVWSFLSTEHLNALQPQATILQARLFALKMEPAQSADAYLDAIELLHDDLVRLGSPLPTATLVSHALRGLTSASIDAASIGTLVLHAESYSMLSLRAALRALEAHTQLAGGPSHVAFQARPQRAPRARLENQPSSSIHVDLQCHQ